MAEMTPRLLRGEDEAGAVLGLIRDAFTYMEDRIDPPSSLVRLDVAGVLDQAKTGEVWVLGDDPVGVVFLTPKPHALYLGKLAIRADRRGHGFGRLLVEHAIARASVLGFDTVELQTRVELVENQAAFIAMGFYETGQTAHAGYDRPTSITFCRELS